MRCIFQCRSMSGGLQLAHVSLHMLVSPASVSCSGQQLHDELVQSYVYVYIYLYMFLQNYLIYICTEHYWASLVYATYRYVLQVCIQGVYNWLTNICVNSAYRSAWLGQLTLPEAWHQKLGSCWRIVPSKGVEHGLTIQQLIYRSHWMPLTFGWVLVIIEMIIVGWTGIYNFYNRQDDIAFVFSGGISCSIAAYHTILYPWHMERMNHWKPEIGDGFQLKASRGVELGILFQSRILSPNHPKSLGLCLALWFRTGARPSVFRTK